MSIIEPGSASAGLIARVRGLLTRPDETWEVIADEPATEGGLFRSYVIPLVAIPAVASSVGLAVFGVGGFGVSFRPSPLWVAVSGVLGFALSLLMVWLSARVIRALAPNFGGAADPVRAAKVAAYSPTAYWVLGIVTLFPMLAVLALLGAIWSLFLLHKGLGRLMGAPPERALAYTAAVAVVMFILGLLAGGVAGAVTSTGVMSGAVPGVGGKVEIAGQGSVDLGELQSAAEKAAAAARAVQSGEGPPPTSTEALQAMLPAVVGGFTRESVKTGSGGVAGFEGSQAEGVYTRGAARLTLSVTDVGAAGALAGLAGAFDARKTEETATGYEKVGVIDGRRTQETYDRAARRGEYGVMIGERFMVQAEGDGVGMDELKAAVGAVDARKLEAIAEAER
jgi:hypothetical protein